MSTSPARYAVYIYTPAAGTDRMTLMTYSDDVEAARQYAARLREAGHTARVIDLHELRNAVSDRA